MKFLLDENFPCSSADFIESCGHVAVRFDDVCDYGADDDTVFATARRLGAAVKEKKSAVKATVEVPAPSGKNSQFFKVKFGE